MKQNALSEQFQNKIKCIPQTEAWCLHYYVPMQLLLITTQFVSSIPHMSRTFEDAKWVIRSRKSKKGRQYNGQKEHKHILIYKILNTIMYFVVCIS
jgi:hypothetical protein